MTEDEMAGQHHYSMDVSLSELREFVMEGGLAFCASWGHKESDTTEHLNSTECTVSCHVQTVSALLLLF